MDRALEIVQAAEPENLESVADLELGIGRRLARAGGGYRDALPYLRSAQAKLEQLLGASHPKTAQATLTLGEAFIATKEYVEGAILLEKAIEFYAGKPDYVPLRIQAHQVLMALYSNQGDDDLYTEQLMEVGRLSEGLMGPIEYLPISKYPPLYPQAAARCMAEGYVVMEFTVDEQGRVRDPAIVESDASCGNAAVFHEASLASVRRWRYIPRFENGVAVSVPNVRNRIAFEVGATVR
jgi:TonB family protein